MGQDNSSGGVEIEGNGDGRAPPPLAGWAENTIITERRRERWPSSVRLVSIL
jgi:hypothetical protein